MGELCGSHDEGLPDSDGGLTGMSRVLLAGCPGGSEHSGEGACAARTSRFLAALEGAGHEVSAVSGAGPAGVSKLRNLLAGGRFDSVTAISPYPAEAAALAGSGCPLWIDINGSHTSEVVCASDDPVTRRMHAVRISSLESALLAAGDAFSTPTSRQRLAVLGELLISGRIGAAALAAPPVHAIPHCAMPRTAGIPRRQAPAGCFPVVSTGSFNTWFDHETLFRALEGAMKEDGRISFTATGGPTPHSGGGWAEFSALAASSPMRDRFRLAGWLPGPELAEVLEAASAAVYADLPGLETELGARTRTLDWIARGIPVVCTSGSEVAAEVESHGLGLVVPQRDPVAMAGAILRLASDPGLACRISEAQGRWRLGPGSLREIFAPYLQWVGSPARVLSAPFGKAPVPRFGSAAYRIFLFRDLAGVFGLSTALRRALGIRHREAQALRQ